MAEKAGSYLVKAALEAAFALSAIIPLLVNDSESDVFVRWAGDEADEACVVFTGGSKGLALLAAILPLDLVGGRL